MNQPTKTFQQAISDYEDKKEPAQELKPFDRENFIRELSNMEPLTREEFMAQEKYYQK